MFFENNLTRCVLLGMLALPLSAAAQTPAANGSTMAVIKLVNPSFEDLPKCCEAPTGWYNCGKAEESPPDIQPGSFQVSKAPSHGETYLGLVVRDNDTWEGVAQRLSRPLDANQCYEFSLDVCRAELYLSLSRTTGEEVNYVTPAKLRIWGGMGYCDKRELLYESALITNTRWLSTTMRFTPKTGGLTFIFIEAYFKTPTLFPYNGNILIDNASAIRQVPCATKPPVAAPPPAATTKAPPRQPVTTPTQPAKPRTDTAVKKPAAQPVVTTKMDRKILRTGSIIRLNNIYFDADKFDITDRSLPALEEVYAFLANNSDVSVEIGGHTNSRPTDDFATTLSTNRARSVAQWLIAKGIAPERVQFKGYGKKYPIETNYTEEGRMKNQRVEIKILSIRE